MGDNEWMSDVDSGYVYREGVRMDLDDPSDDGSTNAHNVALRAAKKQTEELVALLGEETAAMIGHAVMIGRQNDVFVPIGLFCAADQFFYTALEMSKLVPNQERVLVEQPVVADGEEPF
jgi:hypothetical protein